MSACVGIDVHRKRSQVEVINEGGEVLANRNAPNGLKPLTYPPYARRARVRQADPVPALTSSMPAGSVTTGRDARQVVLARPTLCTSPRWLIARERDGQAGREECRGQDQRVPPSVALEGNEFFLRRVEGLNPT